MEQEIRVEHNHPVFSRLLNGKKNRKDILISGNQRVLCSQLRTNGSWTAYEYRNLETLASKHYNKGEGPPSFTGANNLLEKGYYFLLTGDYQGKPCNPRIVLHPEDFIRLCQPRCTAHPDCRDNEETGRLCHLTGPSLTLRDKNILRAHCATGKARALELEKVLPSEAELMVLVNFGYLKRQGRGLGLTTEGRNQIE